MVKRAINILAVSIGLLTASYQAQAVKVNVDVDIHTSTEYHECQGYADNIVDLCRLLVASESPEDKSYIKKEIKCLKKHLKKCEKRNGKRKHSSTVKIGGSHEFNK